MSIKTVVGAQWGDEGKGKIIDWLCEDAEHVIRFQGGNNAGHTIVSEGKTYKLSLLPSGVISGKYSLIASGVVVNPQAFFNEKASIESQGIVISPENLGIAETATLVLPYHIALDKAREQYSTKIGTTLKGIGPAYEDRVGRRAIRLVDLLDLETVEARLENILFHYNALLQSMNQETFATHDVLAYIKEHAVPLLDYMVSDTEIVEKAFFDDKSILFEGAQAVMLDINHGTYPYVTSSNTVSAQTSIGTGYGYPIAGNVIGVAKAYCTRVGEGPFVSELLDETGDIICQKGQEYGTVTGRKRRCGWLDIVALNYAIVKGGITELAITKGDILDEMDEIKICVGYKHHEKVYTKLPLTIDLYEVEPIYQSLPGWKSSTFGITTWDQLPKNYKDFIYMIEELTKTPVSYLSTGPDREHTFKI